MTPQELDEIEKRANAAFKGPWRYTDFEIECNHQWEEDDCQKCDSGIAEVIRVEAPHEYPEENEDYYAQVVCDVLCEVPGLQELANQNGAFIAHARADVPALIAEVRRLRSLVKRVEVVADVCTYAYCPWCKVEIDGRSSSPPHAPACPAFTPEGEVK